MLDMSPLSLLSPSAWRLLGFRLPVSMGPQYRPHGLTTSGREDQRNGSLPAPLLEIPRKSSDWSGLGHMPNHAANHEAGETGSDPVCPHGSCGWGG